MGGNRTYGTVGTDVQSPMVSQVEDNEDEDEDEDEKNDVSMSIFAYMV